MAIQTPEQLGDALAKAIHDPTKSQMAKLTEIVKVVDSDGNETGQEKARFVLKPTAYLDIKAYIAAGLAFPESVEAFQTLHPKENLKKLVELDATIYETTQLAMVRVHKSCKDFNTSALPNFRRVTNEAKQFANSAILALTGFDTGSFRGLLKVLTDNKYEKAGSEDTREFRGAREAASIILQDLSQQSLKKAETIQVLINNVTSFLTVLKTDKEEIDKVCNKYSGEKGYSSTLNASLDSLRKDIKKAVEDAKAARDQWSSDKATADRAVAYIWVPVAGWISGTTVLIIYNNRAKEAWAKYQKNLDLEISKKEETGYMERLIADVDLLQSQNTNISGLMEKAKLALQDIQKVFEQIGHDLNQASSLMGSADALLRGGLWARQNTLISRVDQAVKDWKNVVAAADDFLNAEAAFSGITDSVIPPKSG